MKYMDCLPEDGEDQYISYKLDKIKDPEEKTSDSINEKE